MFMMSRADGKSSKIQILFLACFSLVWLSYNAIPSHAEGPGDSPSKETGFEAVITGTYDGEAFGTGVLVLLLGAGFEKQGYFFLSDGQEFDPMG